MLSQKLLSKIGSIQLRDNPDVETGGTAFAGETVLDFLFSIDETDVECMNSVDDLNQALIECGIMPIEVKGE